VTLGDLTFGPSGILYGWSSSRAGSNLYTVDLATGAATQVGSAGLTTAGSGLAFDRSGFLYLTGGDRAGTMRLLYTIDPATGLPLNVETLTGSPLANGVMPALAEDEAGTLFGVVFQGMQTGGTAYLVTINPATGVIITLGPTAPGLDAITFLPAGVPEPATFWLGGVGLLGLLGYAWRRQRAT
jgi:hypothetical protein